VTRNTLQRLALFGLGIPALIAIVLFFPFARYGVLVVLVLILQTIASSEMITLCSCGGKKISAVPSIIAAVFTGLAVYVSCIFESTIPGFSTPMEMLGYASVISFLFLLSPAGFARKEEAPDLLRNIAARALTHFYVGILGAFLIIILSDFDSGPAPIFTFLLMTFGNDSLAWLTGTTLGKRRGIVPMSPNKSVAGFVGGLAGSIGGGFIAPAIFPDAGFPGFFGLLLFGLAMGVAVIAGDLAESGFKRSAGVKDSGSLVPGRGGVLDSIDSILFSAPVFLLLAKVIGIFSTGI